MPTTTTSSGVSPRKLEVTIAMPSPAGAPGGGGGGAPPPSAQFTPERSELLLGYLSATAQQSSTPLGVSAPTALTCVGRAPPYLVEERR